MVLMRTYKTIINYHKINILSKNNLINVDKQLNKYQKWLEKWREIIEKAL
jgi:hypothetical protein